MFFTAEQDVEFPARPMQTGSDARCLTTGLTHSSLSTILVRLRIEAHEDFVFQEGSCAEPRPLLCVRKVYRVCSNMFDPSSKILYSSKVSACSEEEQRILITKIQ